MPVVNPLYDETTGLAKLGTAAYTAASAYATPTGNVATATALATPQMINGIVFDGTTTITITAAQPVTISDDFIPTEIPEFIGAL